jgi:hypothetical protein
MNSDNPPNPDTSAVVEPAGPSQPPDRLSTNPKSPFFNAPMLERGIGIRFKGVERHNVDEYCVSEGWIRVPAGKTVDRRGQPMTLKLTGPVEAYFRDAAAPGG